MALFLGQMFAPLESSPLTYLCSSRESPTHLKSSSSASSTLSCLPFAPSSTVPLRHCNSHALSTTSSHVFHHARSWSPTHSKGGWHGMHLIATQPPPTPVACDDSRPASNAPVQSNKGKQPCHRDPPTSLTRGPGSQEPDHEPHEGPLP